MSNDVSIVPTNRQQFAGRRKRRPLPSLMVRAPEAARLCGTSEASWWRWVAGGLCPAGLRVAGQRLWSRRSLMLWVRWGCPPREEFETLLSADEGRR
jgi:hypothetical protein